MPQPNFRIVDNNREHARDIARREVKRFMLDREKDEKQNVCNQHGEEIARALRVDDILEKAGPSIMEEQEPYEPHPFLIRFSIFALIVAAILITYLLFKELG